MGRLPRGSVVTNRGTLSLTNWTGDYPLQNDKRTPIEDLTVSGGNVFISRSKVEGLKLCSVETLTIGSGEGQAIQGLANDVHREERLAELFEQQALRINSKEGRLR